jgi:hypothetical protein
VLCSCARSSCGRATGPLGASADERQTPLAKAVHCACCAHRSTAHTAMRVHRLARREECADIPRNRPDIAKYLKKNRVRRRVARRFRGCSRAISRRQRTGSNAGFRAGSPTLSRGLSRAKILRWCASRGVAGCTFACCALGPLGYARLRRPRSGRPGGRSGSASPPCNGI